jgi:uncharacterized protein YegL
MKGVHMSRIFNQEGQPTSEVGMQKRTFVGIALDRSGSMEMMREPTITGFNEHLQTIKDNAMKGGDTRVSLVTFGGDVTTEFVNLPADKIRPLTNAMYKPRGSTPMYDAVGDLLQELEEYDVTFLDIAFLVIVISDGQENASRRYNRNQIAQRIQRLKATGRWTFAYVGANQDLYEAQDFGFSTTTWVYNPTGTARLYDNMSMCTDSYFTARGSGASSVSNYFSPTQTTGNSDVTLTKTDDKT